jgi:iron uptake system component EfeO
MPRPARLHLTGLLVLATATLAACGGGGDEGSSDTTGAVEVVSTNDACTPAMTTFAPGKVKLAIKNNGSSATELYVYEGDKVLTEVENVGPGTSRSLTADFKAGKTYQLSCKPGSKEIKVPVSVG